MPKIVFIKIVCLISALLYVSACSVTDRVTYADGEGRVPPDVIKRIKTKPTSKMWVMSQLGDPMHIDRIETVGRKKELHYEIYTYRFSRTFIRSAQVLYVFKSGAREEEVEYFHIAFENGLSQRAWMDHLSRPHLATQMRKAPEKVKSTKVASKEQADRMVEPEKNERMNWKLPILKRWFGSDNVPEDSSASKAPEAEKPVMTMEPQASAKGHTEKGSSHISGKAEMEKTPSAIPSIKGEAAEKAPDPETVDIPSIDMEGEVAL